MMYWSVASLHLHLVRVTDYMIRWRHMQYLIRLSDLLQAFQDQDNIIVPLLFSRGEQLFCPYSYTQGDIREF